MRKIREFGDFINDEVEVKNEKVNINNESVKKAKPLIQSAPVFYCELDPKDPNYSPVPNGIDLQREVVENHTKLNSFELALRDLGILPSASWTDGKSKNIYANIFSNICEELTGSKKETKIKDNKFIIEKSVEIDTTVDKVEIENKNNSKSVNFDFYNSEVEDLAAAPDCCMR